MKTIQIERRPGLSKEEFNREYLKGIGKPVIVPDGIQEWPARTKWSFEYLKKTYGSDTVVVAAGLESRVMKMTKLAAYIDHLDKADQDLPGFWLDPATALPRAEPIEPAKSRFIWWAGMRSNNIRNFSRIFSQDLGSWTIGCSH